MLRKYFMLSILLMSLHVLVQSQTYISSKISDITVYLNKLQVTRVAEVGLTQGSNSIIIEALPYNIDANTIQVKSSSGVTVLSVKHKVNYLTNQLESKYINKLRDSIEIFEKKQKQQEMLLQVLKNEEELILANKNTGSENTGVSVIILKDLSQLYRVRLKEIGNQKIETEIEIQQLKEKLKALKDQLNTVTRNKKPTSEVWVDVQASQTTRAKIQVSYIASGASWSPVYDIRAQENSDKVEVLLKAAVVNNTGEDWQNVQLKLSTGNPSRSMQKPDLSPWFLYFDEYVAYDRMMLKSAPVAQVEVQEVAAAMDDEYDLDFKPEKVMSTMSNNNLNMEFDIELPYSVTSGKEPVQVLIQKQMVEAKMQYSAIPKLSPHVYLTAILKDWQQYQLLGGEASVYYNKAYVGKSIIPSNALMDSIIISLGIDESILISREKATNYKSRQTIGSQVKETRMWNIEIKNNKQEDIIVLVQDQIPVSTNKDIEIKPVETSGGKLDAETGFVTWNLSLKARNKQTIKLGYEVKYPESKKVILE